MFFQIKEIILWPRDAAREPRRVPFILGKVNVISGVSRTGKSAVIPIIDYCLAAGSCSIPVKTIRDSCEWFGVVIATSSGDKLLARREPGTQRSTDDMFLMEDIEISEIPMRVTKNTNADSVRRKLDELAGLSNLDFAAGEQESGFDARPSFRDLAAFTFQPQNIIANPDVLFFKTNTYEHREKLRKIFPYILGAVSATGLALQHELKRLQSNLRRLEKELKETEDVSARWFAELGAKVSEARELGLLVLPQGATLTREQMIERLDEIVKRTDLTLAVTVATISDAIQELNELAEEETTVSHELTTLRRRLTEMNRIQTSASNYHGALQIQRDRLQISDWLMRHNVGDENCPICGGNMDSADEKLKELHNSLKSLEETSGINVEIPAAFDRELQRVQAEVNEVSERLKSVQVRKTALSNRSQEARQNQFQAQRAERFVGNLENALELHRRLGESSELKVEVGNLRAREQQLLIALREHDIEAGKRRALRVVDSNAGRLLPALDAERPDDPLSLEINDLTIKVTGANREDYLSEIGSGSNWLSYHIAVLLGLHQYFLTLSHSPVPGFLVIDQPSQVYFPKRVTIQEGETPDEPQLRDQDIEAVRKAYQVFGKVVAAANGKLQVIVLDHAPRDIWEDIQGVVALEEWRDGRTLVPAEWLD